MVSEIEDVRALLADRPRPVGWPERRQRMDEICAIDPPAGDIAFTRFEIAGIPAEWSLAPGSDPGTVLIYLHGGGYCSGSIRSHRGMVGEIGARSGKRAITLYETTDTGLDALRRWVQHFPGQDQVVIKHPVILKAWLSRGEDPERIVETLDRHLEATRARLDEALWSRQRSRELGITDDPSQRFSFAVLDYAIRGLYAELSNIAQLRDEIASGTTQDPVKRVRRAKGQIRRRVPRSPG
jgi:hypothetical protein